METKVCSLLCALVPILPAVGCCCASRSAPGAAAEAGGGPAKPVMFLPPPLTDDWTRWIVGEWEGAGESDAGKGKGTIRVELALSGQFLFFRGESQLSDLNEDYLEKNLHASREEIDRFKSSGYQALEIYTIDQGSGDVLGFLFDNLRCIAKGRGRREGQKEIVDWEWATGHKSTRITERVDDDRFVVIERTPLASGEVMEDRGEMRRIRPRAGTGKP